MHYSGGLLWLLGVMSKAPHPELQAPVEPLEAHMCPVGSTLGFGATVSVWEAV